MKKIRKSIIKRSMAKNKLAQEEMVGFILIVVLVSIMALVFFAISMARQPKQEYRSEEVSNFLKSFLQYTTECESRYLPLDMADAIKGCAENEAKECDNGELVCDVMHQAIGSIMNDSWHYSNESYLKGYEFAISIETNITDAATTNGREAVEQLSELKRGNCNVAVKRASDIMLPLDERDIRISMKACYAG